MRAPDRRKLSDLSQLAGELTRRGAFCGRRDRAFSPVVAGTQPARPPQTVGPVQKLLSGLIGAPTVYFLPSRGNGGDSLIDVGFFDMARSLGVSWRVIGPDTQLSQDDVLILAGGGNLVPEYQDVARALMRFARTVRLLILLPHSIRGHAQVLRGLGPNVHLFAREHVSLEYASGVATNAHVFFDHDMAFHANLDALRRRGGVAGFSITPKNAVRMALLPPLQLSARRTSRLSAFRTDCEKLTGSPGHLSNDVSRICGFGTATEAQCYFSAARFIQTIDRFSEVETDRLHVAIAAARLGKRTFLYDNNYYKCRAVYEASLSGFENVSYRGAFDVS